MVSHLTPHWEGRGTASGRPHSGRGGCLSPAAIVLALARRRSRKTAQSEHNGPKGQGVHAIDKEGNSGNSQAQTIEVYEPRDLVRSGQQNSRAGQWAAMVCLYQAGWLGEKGGRQRRGNGWRLHCLPAWSLVHKRHWVTDGWSSVDLPWGHARTKVSLTQRTWPSLLLVYSHSDQRVPNFPLIGISDISAPLQSILTLFPTPLLSLWVRPEAAMLPKWQQQSGRTRSSRQPPPFPHLLHVQPHWGFQACHQLCFLNTHLRDFHVSWGRPLFNHLRM